MEENRCTFFKTQGLALVGILGTIFNFGYTCTVNNQTKLLADTSLIVASRTEISAARMHFEDIAAQAYDDSDDLVESAMEGLLTAFESACALYNDKKIFNKKSKRIFRAIFYDEIVQLMTNEEILKLYLNHPSHYPNIQEVYNKWKTQAENR